MIPRPAYFLGPYTNTRGNVRTIPDLGRVD